MQSVSTNLKNSLARQTPVYAKSVLMYRKIWNGAAYVFEGSPIDITAQVVDAGRIYWKLDKEGFNQWSLDNTTLTLRNDHQQWKQDNPKGYFPSPYLMRGSKIKISFGAQLADGTYEKPYIFTGYMLTDPIKSSAGKEAVITLTGPMSVFNKFNAEDICIMITDEVLGSGSGTTFITDQVGVGPVLYIKRGTTAGGVAGAVEIKPGIDYTLEDQNTKGVAMTVNLVVALTATESLWIKYRKWYTDKTIEWLMEQVMILAGISTYAIVPAVFATNIPTTWTQTSQADWNASTLENIDTITRPGSFRFGVLDDFSDGDYTANPAWTLNYESSEGVVSVDTSRLKFSAPAYGGAVLKLASTRNAGSWEFRAWPNPGTLGNQIKIHFMGNAPAVPYGVPTEGYYVRCYASTYGNQINLYKRDPVSDVALLTANVLATSNDVIRVNRTSAGVFTMYVNEVLVGTVTDNTWSTVDGIYVNTVDSVSTATVKYFTDLYFWAEGTTLGRGVLTSIAHDASASLTSWGQLTATYTRDAWFPGDLDIETYTSGTSDFSSDNDPAGWVAISTTGQINSAVKRYIKFRVIGTMETIAYPVSPATVDNIAIVYFTSSTTISFVNLTGMNCLSVIDSCAQKCNYERGFTANEEFIFRPRATTIPAVMDFSSASNTVRLTNITDGVDRVYNYVTATTGTYTNVSSAEGDTSPNSIDKYEQQIYNVPGDALLPNENVNLAYAMTPTILAYTKLPRRRCQAVTMFIPFLELGDKVTLTFEEPTAFRSWHWGDTNVVYGQGDIEYYEDADKTARIEFNGTAMRVEGIELDWWRNKQCTFDLVEVL